MAHVHYPTLLGRDFGRRVEATARPGYEAFLADGGSGASSDTSVQRLLSPMEALVDQAAKTLDAVLTGRLGLAEAEAQGWDATAALRRVLEVVYGPEQADVIAAQLDDPAGLADAVAAGDSPWRHPNGVADMRFSWERSIRPINRGSSVTPEAYRTAMLDFLDLDHRWAVQGNLSNPAKAAADGVWRDLRHVLAAAVDFGGVSARSHRDFFDVFTRHLNRFVNGSALGVMEKVRALVRHGIVDVSAGPEAEVHPDRRSGRFVVRGGVTSAVLPVDVLVDSRIHPFDAVNDVLPLYSNLLKRGLVRRWCNPGMDGPDFAPGGLDLAEDFHPVREGGGIDRQITVLGWPSEGVEFFQYGALRPNQNHHLMQDILCLIPANRR